MKIFAKNFWELAILKNAVFLSRPFFCFISMKTSQSFLGSKDGSKFWFWHWFPAVFYPGQTLCTQVYIKIKTCWFNICWPRRHRHRIRYLWKCPTYWITRTLYSTPRCCFNLNLHFLALISKLQVLCLQMIVTNVK